RDVPMRFIRVAWSPDGRHLASSDETGSIFVWNTNTWTLLLRLEGHQGEVKGIEWSPDGTRLASAAGGESGGLFVWDIRRGKRRHTIQPAELLSSVAWGAFGNTLISGGNDGRLRWWDIASSECLLVRDAHNGMVQSLRRSPDGTMLASCGDDGAIMLW